MKRRVTIYLDEELSAKIKDKQANLLEKNTHSVSFSQVLNQTLKEALHAEKIILQPSVS